MTSLISVVVISILIVAVGLYFFTQKNFTPAIKSSTETQTSTTVTSSATTSTVNNFLRRKFYINYSSGNGLIWFGNSTITDVRDGIYAWQTATNGLIQFNEVNDTNADITVSFVSGINQTTTTKTIGETYAKVGLIKGSIQIIPQGVPCRNVGIIEHELGHIIGLDHNQTNRFDIMYTFQSYGCDQNISAYDVDKAKNLINELIS